MKKAEVASEKDIFYEIDAQIRDKRQIIASEKDVSYKIDALQAKKRSER